MSAGAETADLLVSALARDIADSGIRVYAVTSPSTVTAALAARSLGAGDLAIAGGFTALDASPMPAVTLGERGLLSEGPAVRDWATDTFVLLARGRVGVAVSPAQIDSRGRANLSGIGEPGTPKVALPGSLGLPDNGPSPSRVWILLPAHSPRQLVDAVDFVSAPGPEDGAIRRLLTPAGCFEHRGQGWVALWLTPDGAGLVAEAPGLGVDLRGDEPVLTAPDAEALTAVEAADPNRTRHIEFASGGEALELWQEAAARERASADRRS